MNLSAEKKRSRGRGGGGGGSDIHKESSAAETTADNGGIFNNLKRGETGWLMSQGEEVSHDWRPSLGGVSPWDLLASQPESGQIG